MSLLASMLTHRAPSLCHVFISPAASCSYCDIFCERLLKNSLDLVISAGRCRNSNSLSFFFPSSLPRAKVCEEKLRYAAYNCVAIDTDMSPWEE